jgi:hypothetical protein
LFDNFVWYFFPDLLVKKMKTRSSAKTPEKSRTRSLPPAKRKSRAVDRLGSRRSLREHFTASRRVDNEIPLEIPCRVVCIGSYRIFPHKPVTINVTGISLDVTIFCITTETSVNVELKIPATQLNEVMGYFEPSASTLLITTTRTCADNVRRALMLPDSQPARGEAYFCPDSQGKTRFFFSIM